MVTMYSILHGRIIDFNSAEQAVCCLLISSEKSDSNLGTDDSSVLE